MVINTPEQDGASAPAMKKVTPASEPAAGSKWSTASKVARLVAIPATGWAATGFVAEGNAAVGGPLMAFVSVARYTLGILKDKADGKSWSADYLGSLSRLLREVMGPMSTFASASGAPFLVNAVLGSLLTGVVAFEECTVYLPTREAVKKLDTTLQGLKKDIIDQIVADAKEQSVPGKDLPKLREELETQKLKLANDPLTNIRTAAIAASVLCMAGSVALAAATQKQDTSWIKLALGVAGITNCLRCCGSRQKRREALLKNGIADLTEKLAVITGKDQEAPKSWEQLQKELPDVIVTDTNKSLTTYELLRSGAATLRGVTSVVAWSASMYGDPTIADITGSLSLGTLVLEGLMDAIKDYYLVTPQAAAKPEKAVIPPAETKLNDGAKGLPEQKVPYRSSLEYLNLAGYKNTTRKPVESGHRKSESHASLVVMAEGGFARKSKSESAAGVGIRRNS